MSRNSTLQPRVSPPTPSLGRRAVLRSVTTAGLLATVGIPPLVRPATAAIDGVTIDYKRCKVVFVSNASAIDAIAVYYADRDGDRNARYDIKPTVTNPRGYAPLVVEYDADGDRTQIQLAEPRGSLVCVVAEAGTDRTVRTNPTDVCVPAGFNTAPEASFTVSADPTVSEEVTFTSTATDPDSPERLSYAWDLDDDGVFEASGESVTTTFETPGEKTVVHRVTDDCGASDTATRTITVDAGETEKLFEQVATLTAGDADRGDFAGQSVSIDGDTALVGARSADPDGISEAGAAYVFTRSGGTWSQQAKLTAADAETRDGFGRSVSVNGDTALVGAANEDRNGISEAGAAYVFTRSGGTWSQQAKLTASDAQPLGFFGYAVSVDGDTALIGANEAAYVFTRSGGTWSQRAKLTAGDGFGRSVSLGGDTALVGAPGEDLDGKINAGAAYVFTRSGGTWSRQAKLTAADAEARDEFGRSVSTDGDTALVGAYLADPDGRSEAGAAYVFTRSGGTWSQQAKLTAADAEAVDWFGVSVSVAGDTALVGADREAPDGKSQAGAAYVFTRSGRTWTQQQKLTDSDAEVFDRFGWSVSVDGSTALISAPLADPDGKSSAGSSYVFST